MDIKLEKEIKHIVREEMKELFCELQSDVSETKTDIKEIKKALLGDEEFLRKGIITQVVENTDYIDKNKTLNVSERGLEVIEWFNDWNNPKNGYKISKLELLDEIMNAYSKIKWLFGAIIGLGLINLPASISSLIEIIARLSK